MSAYDFKATEAKWQSLWETAKPFACNVRSDKPKMFVLVEFPYPSAAGLHVGHPRSYTALDVIARKRRMEGFEVMYGMGWDAFGLNAELYAIKTGIHPRVTTQTNTANFRRQLKALGFSFDWDREIDTTDPAYYKWTQWMFLQLFKQGLAYKAPTQINFCPACKTTLANEEVVNGGCERCGGPVERRIKEQWMLRITQYGDRLANELDTVNYISPVVDQQRNWIGRSEGAEINFTIAGVNDPLRVYTTRPDTLFGATYMVLAPEHALIDQLKNRITNWADVEAYRKLAASKSDIDRTDLSRDKTGVCLKGLSVRNPATGKDIPVWISDYVLMGYGAGAIMAVPGHDERDWAFATKFGLPVVEVVSGGDVTTGAYAGDGVLVNSGFLNGLSVPDAKAKMIAWLADQGLGAPKVNYKLRDWIFSRQRYWGEPIPLVHCADCGWVPLPEDQLPLVLPELDDFRPTDDGSAPLAKLTDWVNTTCPHCGGKAVRETDTMPQWAGSCWYYMRYLDPHNDKAFCDRDILDKWLPVDWYNGGMEHTTLHLLYSRFWHKALADGGFVPGLEPYGRRTSHGMILGSDNEKMSKSRGNVVNPDAVVEQHGADVFRTYEMFMGDFDKTAPWSDTAINGVARFLKKIWALVERADATAAPTLEQSKALHRTLRDVSDRIERMKFNTAVSALMELTNLLTASDTVPASLMRDVITMLSLFAPHMAEEAWEKLGGQGLASQQAWPVFDPALATDDTVTLAVQVNGKLRATIQLPRGTSAEDTETAALADDSIRRVLDGKTPKKVIVIPDRIVNVVA